MGGGEEDGTKIGVGVKVVGDTQGGTAFDNILCFSFVF